MIDEHKWIQDLRSGRYAQGYGALKVITADGEVRHCCLGVAAEQLVEQGAARWGDPIPLDYTGLEGTTADLDVVRDGNGPGTAYYPLIIGDDEPYTGLLPDDVAAFLTVRGIDQRYLSGLNDDVVVIAQVSGGGMPPDWDERTTYETIAQEIERNWREPS